MLHPYRIRAELTSRLDYLHSASPCCWLVESGGYLACFRQRSPSWPGVPDCHESGTEHRLWKTRLVYSRYSKYRMEMTIQDQEWFLELDSGGLIQLRSGIHPERLLNRSQSVEFPYPEGPSAEQLVGWLCWMRMGFYGCMWRLDMRYHREECFPVSGRYVSGWGHVRLQVLLAM